MDKNKTLEMIKALSDAPGISGFEDEVLGVIRRYGAGLGEFAEDSLRNLYLKRHQNTGGKPVVQLDAHSDEVGFMVKTIRSNGMIEFIPIGGWVATNIPAHRVLIRNMDGKYIPGVVASKPPHFMGEAERKAPLEITSLVIDVGASSAKEVLNDYRIGIAAPVVPDADFEYDPVHDIMTGKAFDNRLGCGSIISTFQELPRDSLKVDVVGAFASQEEVGLRGAIVSTQVVKPDAAIVFEGCPADDTLVDAYASQTGIKKGPMLRHIDLKMITNPRFQRFALDTAKEKGIPVQEAVRSGGSTNGGIIHLINKAVPVIVIGCPVRYAHTHYGISAYTDYENGVRLACGILRKLDETIIRNF